MGLEDDTDLKTSFFILFKKNCCGFAATRRIVICIVRFRTYAVPVSTAERDRPGVPALQTHLCPAQEALLNEELEYFIG